MPDLVRRTSSFLRSSSTRALACSWRRAGSLRRVRGEADQSQLLPPAGTGSENDRGCRSGRGSRVLGFYPVVAVAGWVVLLAWHRRRPGTWRGCNRRQPSWMLNSTFACCTPARTLVGLRLPGEENDPTSGGTICAALGPSPAARSPMLNSAFRGGSRMAFAGKFRIAQPCPHLHQLDRMRYFALELSSY